MSYLDLSGLSTFINTLKENYIFKSSKGKANGIPSLDNNSKIVESQMPNHVVEYNSMNEFPTNGTSGQFYVDKATSNTYRWDTNKYILVFRGTPKIYSYYIDGEEADPYKRVQYLGETVNMKPAYMDYTKDTFVWGSWKDAFFMPRPCMLKYDGIVDYYLDPDDYTKKEDGTTSDVANLNYEGNAMMEWGRDGQIIWYKIVPSGNDDSSATVYIANYQVDNDYVCWSFMNNEGDIVDHFYTAIYYGYVDSSNRMRSISGTNLTKVRYERAISCSRNNYIQDDTWFISAYCDWILILLLSILMSRSTDLSMLAYYYSVSSLTELSNTPSGSRNDKGLFYSTSDRSTMKVFGMENYWCIQSYTILAGAGYYQTNTRYKMTNTAKDGTIIDHYPRTATEYNTAIKNDNFLLGPGYTYVPSQEGGTIYEYGNIYKMKFTKDQFIATVLGSPASNNTYYTSQAYFSTYGSMTGVYVLESSYWFNTYVYTTDSDYTAMLTYRPLKRNEE